MKKIEVLGVQVMIISMEETLSWIEETINNREHFRHIITGNPEMVMTAQENEEFLKIMNQADLVVPDGIGLILAARYFMGVEIPERVTGFDLSTRLFDLAQKNGYSVYLLGGAPDIPLKAKEHLTKKYSGLNIVGTHHGYLNDENQPKLLEELQRLKPDILLVGMGALRQEVFISKYKDLCQIPVSIGIGGSIDIWAGNKKRAPKLWQDLHLEWFYRLLKEPTRFFRMMSLPKFILYAARYKERRIK
ncbi:MAG: WecB/TagA/CpsF family glycosyltransferase [Halanaerobiales bacterium]|nr:WecB/TagA/CpsF family glycosyltransferase [Halanaerobiales bacterium]